MFVIRRNADIKYTFPRVKLDEGISIFFYNPNSGKDFVSNQLGALIWHIIEEEKSYYEIIEEINKIVIFLDEDKLKEDVLKVCRIMVKQNLAEFVN